MRIFLQALVALLLLLTPSCWEDDSTSVSQVSIDDVLIGAWYRVDTLATLVPGPSLYVDGIMFGGRTVSLLGAESGTGKLGVSDNYYWVLSSAQGGKLTYRPYRTTSYRYETVNYKVNNGTLTLSGDAGTKTYRKGSLGIPVIPAVPCTFSFRVNDEIKNVNACPPIVPAYISRQSASVYTLYASLPDCSVQIKIPAFSGPGSYRLGFGDAVYTINNIDLPIVLSSDSVNVSTITISSYEGAGTATGTFDFYANSGSGYIPVYARHITGGSFRIPVY